MNFKGLNFNNFIIDDILDVAIAEHKKKGKKKKKKSKDKSEKNQEMNLPDNNGLDDDFECDNLEDAFKLPSSKDTSTPSQKETKSEKQYLTIG